MRFRHWVYIVTMLIVLALAVTLTSAPAPSAAASDVSEPAEPVQQEPNPRYSVVGIVDAVDEDAGCTYFVTSADGEFNVFSWRGIRDFEVGDVCSLMIEDIGPGFEHDKILAITSSGWNVAGIFKDLV